MRKVARGGEINAELRDLTELPLITSYIRSQRLSWAGHVTRREDNSLSKGTENGRKYVGRR